MMKERSKSSTLESGALNVEKLQFDDIHTPRQRDDPEQPAEVLFDADDVRLLH